MFKKIATAVGYKKAPMATFLVKHPKAAIASLAVKTGLKKKNNHTMAKVVGVGTVLAAAPVGYFLMSKSEENKY